jgi:N-acetylmuramoyl-L-alanine amidase
MRIAASRLLRAILPALVAVAAGFCAVNAAPTADSVRVAADAAVTEVTLVFDAPAEAEAFTLDDPPRVVADFPGARLALPPTAGAGLVTRLRHGLGAPGRARLVLDLAAPAAVSLRRDGAALTLRLTATDAARFRAGAGWPAGLGPAFALPPGAARPTVAIDPGHGGADPGAIRGGVREKDVTLAFSRDLAARLRAEGFAVALTRDADVFVPLTERVARARDAGADLFLSIHADALPRDAASGVSIYTLSGAASDAEAEALARRENRADAAAGGAFAGEDPDVAAALIDLVRHETLAEGERMARALLAALPRDDLLSGRPHRSAAFRVLKAPEMPSALIEIGFLSSARDRARFEDPAWRARAVSAITEAVTAWFAERRVATAD